MPSKIILLNRFYLPYKILKLDKFNQFNEFSYGPLKLKDYTYLYIENQLNSFFVYYNDPYHYKTYLVKTAWSFKKLLGYIFFKFNTSPLKEIEDNSKELDING